MLDETLVTLAKRQALHGVTTTPLVLASVIRGLTTSGLAVPSWLLDAVRGYFEAGPTAAATAELAEALSRHRSGTALAQQATEIVFSDRHASDPGAAIARWWFADRLKGSIEPTAGVRGRSRRRARRRSSRRRRATRGSPRCSLRVSGIWLEQAVSRARSTSCFRGASVV